MNHQIQYRRPTKKKLDELWADVIKARAGYKSEISGKEGRQIGGEYVLNAHHLIGKPNYRLRYSLENGICITNGEHNYGAHGSWVRKTQFDNRVLQVRSDADVFSKLELLRHKNGKTDLMAVELFLKQELKKYKWKPNDEMIIVK